MSYAVRIRNPIRSAFGRAGLLLALAGLSSGPGVGAVQAADTAAPASHWVERNLDYTFVGFTAKYTCDGLEESVRTVLLALGARKQDLQIQSRGCTSLNGLESFPGVSAHFSVLVPVTADDSRSAGNGAAQPAMWKTVDLVRLTESRSGLGAPCELLEQLKAKALPLFTIRNLRFQSACVPHQVSLGDIQFSVDVLRAVPPGQALTPAA
jgi:hypothetical protein